MHSANEIQSTVVFLDCSRPSSIGTSLDPGTRLPTHLQGCDLHKHPHTYFPDRLACLLSVEFLLPSSFHLFLISYFVIPNIFFYSNFSLTVWFFLLLFNFYRQNSWPVKRGITTECNICQGTVFLEVFMKDQKH